MHSLRLYGIVEDSIVDGPGLRYSVFTQGCPHHCRGCHNPASHAYNGGFIKDTRVILDEFKGNPLLSGMTFSGGEPLEQPEPLLELAHAVKALGKNIYIFTGYTYEKLLSLIHSPLPLPSGYPEYATLEAKSALLELINLADTLVDGAYVEALRDLELKYRGSSNQRLLTQEDRAAIRKQLGF